MSPLRRDANALRWSVVLSTALLTASTVLAQAGSPAAGPAPAAEPDASPAATPAETEAPVQVPPTAAAVPGPLPALDSPPPEQAAAPVATPVATSECEPCEGKNRRTHAEGFGAFMLGIGFFDLSELSDTLLANGYEEIDKIGVVIGGEGHAILESGFVVGGRGGALLYGALDGPDPFQGELSGGFGMADFGFAPVHTKHVLLMATVGVGGYGIGLDIEENQPVSFDEVLADPRRSATVSTGGILVGLTLGFDARIPMPKEEDDEGRGYFTFGLRVGGIFGPQLSDWELGDEVEVSGAPSGALNGGYAAVTIGFGGGDTYGDEAE